MAPSGPLHPTLLLLALAAAGLTLLVTGRRRSHVGAPATWAPCWARWSWPPRAPRRSGSSSPSAWPGWPAQRQTSRHRHSAGCSPWSWWAPRPPWPAAGPAFPSAYALVAALSVLVLGPVAVAMPARRPRWLPVGLLLGVAAAAWAGGPDTEGPLVAAAVLGPTLFGERRRPNPGSWLAPVVLVAWAAADAYRGRPAGLPGPLVALAILGAAVAITGAVTHPDPGGRHRGAACRLATDAVAARTIGLATDLGAAGLRSGRGEQPGAGGGGGGAGDPRRARPPGAVRPEPAGGRR